MKSAYPIELKRSSKYELKSIWSDGFESTVKLEQLRKNCPCSKCTTESEASKKVGFALLQTFTAGMNELVSLEPVGNYAVKARWGDGHETGIYSWDTLRSIFELHKLEDD